MKHKFRAWDRTTNQMRGCYGFNEMEQEVYVCSVADDEFNGRPKTVHALKRSFDEVVVMQSTGLKDKNGVEIYEGDIVSYVDDVYPAYSFIGEVKRQTYQFCIQGQYDIHGFDDYYDMTFEILGNIYENP